MAKALVTGSAGFIGHWLVRALIKRGYHVTGVDNMENGNREYTDLASEFLELDINNISAEVLDGFTYVFHLAALPRVPYSVEHPLETHETNVNGTLKLLLAAKNKRTYN